MEECELSLAWKGPGLGTMVEQIQYTPVPQLTFPHVQPVMQFSVLVLLFDTFCT